MQDWAYKWNMSFNPDRAKQVQEGIFSRKIIAHPYLYFNSVISKPTHTQKHFGLQLDRKLSFSKQTNNKISKTANTIENIRRLQPILLRRSLFTICKSFILTHLDYYVDVNYDQFSNVSSSVQ